MSSQEPVPFYADDTLEDLQRGGFRMLQKKNGFRFGLDSVLLAAYTASFYNKQLKRKLTAADLGAGCGAVSLLLAARLPMLSLVGLELDETSHEALTRNIRLNRLENRLQAVQGDVCLLADGRLTDDRLPAGSFDLVVCNPPYQRQDQVDRHPTGVVPNESSRQARVETALPLDMLLRAAARLLRTGGRLVMVHQVRRLPDILCTLRTCGLEAKTMRLIQTLPDKAPVTFLLAAVRQGRPGGFQTDPPLVVCSSPGVWSNETAALYGLEPHLTPDDLMRGLIRVSESDGDYYSEGDGSDD